jgi:metal-dependent amidase/aminoacylase/carboxypeptidase family protein
MDMAWNMRREHLPLTQRSHYVITNGGGQPNIVPGDATVWYYFREQKFDTIRELYEPGNTISEAAAMATGTTVDAPRARLCRAELRQPPARRGGAEEHRAGRHAEMEPATTRPSPRRAGPRTASS